MAGGKVPSGSLRNHASTASKVSKGGMLGTQPSAPKVKPSTFVGSDDSDSDSDSSSSGSDSDVSDKKVGQTPLPKQKADIAKATPAKSPTVNGLKASVKKEQPTKNIKKEASSTSASSESGSGSESESESGSESESASSSDEKPAKASAKPPAKPPAKSEQATKSTKSKAETKTAAADVSESSSTSNSTAGKVKAPATKTDKKQAPPKSKAKARKQATQSESESDSESSSQASSAGSGSGSGSESESESESEEDSEGSEDPEAQIQQQIKDDVKSAKANKARDPVPASKAEASNKKAKTAKSSAPRDADGDIEMADQSTALTNGGSPTKVGSVPEFVAPDFHLRKLDGSIGASEIAGFFEKAKMEGKQVWYITAPASLPVTVVQDLTIPMDSAQRSLPVLTHDGDDYRLTFDDPSAASSFRLLIPNKKGQEYSELGRSVDQTMHFTRSETFLPEGPASVTTTQTVSKTTRPARPQPEGLRARYTPLGVPASKKTLTPTTSSEDKKPVAKVAAQETAALSTPKSSSKKKRKHDGENGPVATPANKDSSKSASAEKSAKKQKTIRDHEDISDGQAGRKETPVPLPPHLGVGSGSSTKYSSPRTASAVPPATQPAPVHRRSDSPGGRLPSTQLPPKQTPIPIPVPIKGGSGVSTPNTKVREGKERKEKKRSESQLPGVDKVAEGFNETKSPGKSAKSTEKIARTPKNTPILPPGRVN